MHRDLKIKLTKKDKLAAKKAVLDSRQGIVRADGTF
jgi:hypothetical protein